MKSKKFLLIGLFMAGLAATSFAAYEHFNGSSASTECCFPGCCADGSAPDCCKAE